MKTHYGTSIRTSFVAVLAVFASVSALSAEPETRSAEKCSNVLGALLSEPKEIVPYQQDFGSGLYVSKQGDEFHIEPPPVVVSTTREAQVKVSEAARASPGKQFTIVFNGISEGEVLGFKAMLRRDAAIESDAAISAILLDTESKSSASKDYEANRQRAVSARDYMLRRYDWAAATVTADVVDRGSLRETYRLTAGEASNPDAFLLRLRIRSLRLIRDRTADIVALLAKPSRVNATIEQAAHSIITDLKNSDKGITAGTLKVMAGDFLIAQELGMSGQ